MKLKAPTYKMIRSFTGVVNAVNAGEADIGIGGLSMTYERHLKAPYIFPVYQRNLYFKTIKLRPIKNFATIYKPFQGWVWFSILMCIFCITVVFIIFDFFFSQSRNVSLFKALCFAFVPMINESLPHNFFKFKSKTARKQKLLILFLWLPMGIILSYAYRSNLLAMLVKISYEKPINTLEDVVDSKLPVNLYSNTWPDELFKSSVNPIMKQIYDEQVIGMNALTQYGVENIELNRKIDEGEAVTVASRVSYILRAAGLYRLSKEPIASAHIGMVMAKNHPMTNAFNQIALRLVNYNLEKKYCQTTNKLFLPLELMKRGYSSMRFGFTLGAKCPNHGNHLERRKII